MSIFKLFVSIARESTTIATRGVKETSAHLHSVTENKLNHIDSYLKTKNTPTIASQVEEGEEHYGKAKNIAIQDYIKREIMTNPETRDIMLNAISRKFGSSK